MIWLYIGLAVLEALLAYLIWDALSYKVIRGEDLWRIYVCRGGCTRCRKKDVKDYRGELLKTENDDIVYKIGAGPFLEQNSYNPGKFKNGILVAGFLIFLFPLIREPGEEGPGIGIFFTAGGILLTFLANYAIEKTKHRCDEEQKIFWELSSRKRLMVPLHALAPESKRQINEIISHDCYEYAQGWLSKSDKEILKNKRAGDYCSQTKYWALTEIIENGYSLSKYDYCPILGDRVFEEEGETND